MDVNKRVDLLKDEYVMLQNFYEDIDAKGLNIKNWSISVALASIGAGLILFFCGAYSRYRKCLCKQK